MPCFYPSTQALPESEVQHVPDQPEYGILQALCFLIPSVLGMGWALPEGIRGSSLTQDLEGDFGAVLRPVSGILQGSGTPGGRILIRWTEMSKVSSSLRDLFLQGDHQCLWTLAAEMPLRSCGAAAVRSCGHLCSSVPVRGQCRRARTRKLTPWELSFWQGRTEVWVSEG